MRVKQAVYLGQSHTPVISLPGLGPMMKDEDRHCLNTHSNALGALLLSTVNLGVTDQRSQVRSQLTTTLRCGYTQEREAKGSWGRLGKPLCACSWPHEQCVYTHLHEYTYPLLPIGNVATMVPTEADISSTYLGSNIPELRNPCQ